MHKLFAVIRTHGPAWADGRALEEQQDWGAHATFMNNLYADGFVALAGPLIGTPDTLLIIRAQSEDEITSRLAADCWTRLGLLRIVRIMLWELRLGSPL